MRRRNFIQTVSGGAAAAYLAANPLIGFSSGLSAQDRELADHAIEKVLTKRVRIQYPRFVSKNAIRGNHGWGYDETICELVTNQGAKGWGVTLWGRSAEEASAYLVGKKVSDLFAPGIGLKSHFAKPWKITPN